MKAVSILTCGADPTAQRLSTSAIQQAINSAQQNDVIVIPQGRFLTGALFLKSGVSLRLDAGAQLVGSQDLADYLLINTRVAGIDMRWPAGIINIIDCENVSITGTGTIDGLRACKSAILRGRAPTGLISIPVNRCGLNAALFPVMTTISASNQDEDAKRRKKHVPHGIS